MVLELPTISWINRLQYAYKRRRNKTLHDAQVFWPIVSKYLNDFNKTYDVAIAYNQGFATYYVDQFINAYKKYAWLNVDYQKAGYNINFDFKFYCNYHKIIAVSPEVRQGLVNELDNIDRILNITIIKDITDKQNVLQQSLIKQEKVFSQDKINLVTVCRLAKPKGLHLVLAAAKILVDKAYPINWYIIGEGDERAFLEREIKELHLEQHIFLLGATSNPYPYMKASDIYVQTSLFEGLGLTVIEASYLSKPIVCTNFPTVYGILNHEETGLICEMEAGSIASSIERLIVDQDLKSKLEYNLSLKENKDKEITLKQFESLLD